MGTHRIPTHAALKSVLSLAMGVLVATKILAESPGAADLPATTAPSSSRPVGVQAPSVQAETPQTGPSTPTASQMRALGERAAKGDETALGEIEAIRETIYQDIDYERDHDRAVSNLKLMRGAFDVLGEEAGKNSAKALQALKIALATEGLSSFAPDALGTAAAAGNQEALDMLLHHDQWGILLSTTVFSLKKPAANNNEQAVDFLIEVLGNPDDRALWLAASRELVPASVKGNVKAKTALEQFEAAGGLKNAK